MRCCGFGLCVFLSLMGGRCGRGPKMDCAIVLRVVLDTSRRPDRASKEKEAAVSVVLRSCRRGQTLVEEITPYTRLISTRGRSRARQQYIVDRRTPSPSRRLMAQIAGKHRGPFTSPLPPTSPRQSHSIRAFRQHRLYSHCLTKTASAASGTRACLCNRGISPPTEIRRRRRSLDIVCAFRNIWCLLCETSSAGVERCT